MNERVGHFAALRPLALERMPLARSPAYLAFLVSTVGLLLLACAAALRGDLGVLGMLGLTLGWGTIATTGVFRPQLEMYGDVISHGPVGQARVAVTFDDGPHPITTRKVLAVLAGTRHRATFFVLGEKVRRHPDVVQEIQAAGHTIALHGDLHDRLHSFRLPSSVSGELERARDAVKSATGARPRYFRPPLGQTSLTTVRGVRRVGVTLVGWSSRGFDGLRGQSPDAVLDRVSRTLDDGAIILLHDAAEHDDFEPASIAALPRLLALLDERGLTSVGLEALLRR